MAAPFPLVSRWRPTHLTKTKPAATRNIPDETIPDNTRRLRDREMDKMDVAGRVSIHTVTYRIRMLLDKKQTTNLHSKCRLQSRGEIDRERERMRMELQLYPPIQTTRQRRDRTMTLTNGRSQQFVFQQTKSTQTQRERG